MTRTVLIILLTVQVSRAENPRLVEARAAVEDVRYDAAQKLLLEALRRGANGPEELEEIYRLSAAAAIVLGQRDLAQLYYRRMLSIAPAADLPADASPKLREPFVEAQAFMAAQPRFGLHAARKAGAIEVTVTDPLRMAAAVVAFRAGVAIATLPYAGEAVTLPVTEFDPPPHSLDGSAARPGEARVIDAIAVVDEYGNSLRKLERVNVRDVAAPSVQATAPPAALPLLRRWTSWAVISGVVSGVGVSFLIAGQRSKNRLDHILANSPMYYLDDAEAARTSWRRNTQIASVSLAVAGGCAAAAAVMAVIQPDATTRVVGVVTPTGGIVSVTGNL